MILLLFCNENIDYCLSEKLGVFIWVFKKTNIYIHIKINQPKHIMRQNKGKIMKFRTCPRRVAVISIHFFSKWKCLKLVQKGYLLCNLEANRRLELNLSPISSHLFQKIHFSLQNMDKIMKFNTCQKRLKLGGCCLQTQSYLLCNLEAHRRQFIVEVKKKRQGVN